MSRTMTNHAVLAAAVAILAAAGQAGEAAGQAAFAQRCEPSAAVVRPEGAQAQADATLLVNRYFVSAAGGDQARLADLFWRTDGPRWRGPGGESPVTSITDPFVPKGTPEAIRVQRMAFVQGDDGMSARGVWIATLPDPQRPGVAREVAYGVDFAYRQGEWRMLHMGVYPGPDGPPPPRPYCRLTEAERY